MASCHSEDKFQVARAEPVSTHFRGHAGSRAFSAQTANSCLLADSLEVFRKIFPFQVPEFLKNEVSAHPSRWARSTSMVMVNALHRTRTWLECTSMLYTSPSRSWNSHKTARNGRRPKMLARADSAGVSGCAEQGRRHARLNLE